MNRYGWLKTALLLVLGMLTLSPFAGAANGSAGQAPAGAGEEGSAVGPAVAVIPG